MACHATGLRIPSIRRRAIVGDFQDLAVEITERIREHFPDTDLAVQQVLCLAEEAGEFVGAYRRWAGMARQSSPWSDVQAELADVVVTTYVTAHIFGIDIDAMQLDARESQTAYRQVMRVFIAAGKAVEAYDLIRGRNGTALFATRLAVTAAAARSAATVLDIDLSAAVQAKNEEVRSRGWRDRPAGPASE
jgi:NTP pyrophosphatase (non-canonical NTP hydrolase)